MPTNHDPMAEDEVYEPPRVEQVLESSELEREVHYAGVPDPSQAVIG